MTVLGTCVPQQVVKLKTVTGSKTGETSVRVEMVYTAIASVMSDSVRPRRRQPTRLPHPWDSPGKNTGVGCHFLLQCMKMKSESEVAQLCMTLCRPRLLVPVQSLDISGSSSVK